MNLRNRKKGSFWRRTVSAAVAAAVMVNSVPYAGMQLHISIPDWLKISAPVDAEAYDPSRTEFTGDEFVFNRLSDFIDYCYFYQTDTSFAALHSADVITITGDVQLSDDFLGLGTETSPFEGTLSFPSDGSYIVKTPRAFFSYLSDKATLTNVLAINRDENDGAAANAPLLADHVLSGGGNGNWGVEYIGGCSYSGVFGEIDDGATVSLIFTDNTGNDVVFDGTDLADAGTICGRMGEGSSLSLTYSGELTHSVTSVNGNAGGLVGTMEDGAALTMATALASYAPTVEAGGGYAGGLVGDMTATATVGRPASIGGAVTGSEGAGGLYGRYAMTSAGTVDISSSAYQTAATVGGDGFCGGLFGVLETSDGLTITGSSTAQNFTGTGGSCFGGVIGKLTASSLEDTVLISNANIAPAANSGFETFGGVIGCVDSAAYVRFENVTVTATGSGVGGSETFGGAVGETSAESGVFADVSGFTLRASGFNGGGVVGKFHNGVLRLSGTTNMTNGKPADASGCGQLVGENDNVLVYALGSGSDSSWTFNRCSGAMVDDLGTWGEVVRMVNDGTAKNIEDAGIVTVSAAHVVTLAAAAPADMSNSCEFTKTALNIMLNQGNTYGELFSFNAASSRSALLAGSLSADDDIDLTGTGINGFMRDGGDVDSIGCFTGTFDGGGKTITLASGESYGSYTAGQTEGTGQIYRHQHNGLFAVLAGGISDLTVDGAITVRNCVDGMNIGGFAARNGGNVTLTGVSAAETINYHEGSNVEGSAANGKNIGGYIGFIGENGTLNVNGQSSIAASFVLSGHHESWNVYGGAFGKVTAEAFTINIGTTGGTANKLTNSMTADASRITAVSSNSDCGGLIGHISKSGSYSGRTVNINNLEFDGCTIANAANTNAGGFLGYSWLNSTVNINGLTVVSGTVNNTKTGGTAGGNSNFGAMCYSATGKWNVNSLTLTSMTMPGGGGSSVGMIVNKAYDGDDGLYLIVKDSGYTLGSAPTAAPSVFDEIAAYSASNVLGGGKGAGVVSVDMNTGTDSSAVITRTYTKQLTKNDTNSKSRYYYNLNHMSNSDDAQDLVLWSVNRYAAPNIAGEFVPSATPLEGTANMEGLSFYPVPKADGCTIGTLDITFDYNGIYTIASGRDPASSNQHYLMQSGLFIDSSVGSRLTINGTLTLNGNFLQTSNYKGVLISNTMQGSLDSTAGSIILNGIKPMKSGNDVSDGYLLINKIYRKDNIVAIPELKLFNVSTGTGYTPGAVVAKSLIGPAEGPGLKLEFSKIKLDGRSAADTNLALDSAYHTTKSVFKDSTLLASIKTDQDAQLIYNYTFLDDWGTENGTAKRCVTYGYEVSESAEHPGQENKYYKAAATDNRYFTHPDSEPTDSSAAYSFTSYKPYVKQAYTAINPTGLYFRELMVNVMAVGLVNGCGTYNDPYLISTSDQLKSLASFLQDNSKASTLGNVNLPIVKPDSFETGDRWCDEREAHAEYTAANTFTPPAGVSTSWNNSDVQRYVASAYYKITTDITLDDNFVGLGGKTANTAFRGVIVGSGTSSGVPTVTITNTGSNPFINVSNGCVIKDINITVSGNKTINQSKRATNDAYFAYDYSDGNVCKFYGGIIGEIMGGDNIIDNSYVTFDNSTITLNGSNGYGTIVPVGGYVGVVVYGGLIFRNMDAEKTAIASTHLNVKYTDKTYNLADNSSAEAWAALYANPIVGRVINGYAVNETETDAENGTTGRFSVTEDGHYHDEEGRTRVGERHSLKNGTKHYSIADINKSETEKLAVTPPAGTSADGTIGLPNAQSMFILSLITQSCAGTAQTPDGTYDNSLSYGTYSGTVYGMSHNAEYTDVGTSASASEDFSNYASCDTAADTAIPYIIRKYSVGETETVPEVVTTVITSVHSQTVTTVVSDVVSEVIPGEFTYQKTSFDSLDSLDGMTLVISSKRIGERFLIGEKDNFTDSTRKSYLKTTTLLKDATEFTFSKVPGEEHYYISFVDANSQTKYLQLFPRTTTQGDLVISDTPYPFTVSKNNAGALIISGTVTYNGTNYTFYMSNSEKNKTYLFCSLSNASDVGNPLYFYTRTIVPATSTYTTTSIATSVATTVVTSVSTYTTNRVIQNYPARCATSTRGYYDISLTESGTYQLPDSFRGFGCIGVYDSLADNDRRANRYTVKLDSFDGNGSTIDEDIYLNKFKFDNYFNSLHNGSGQSTNSGIANYALDTEVAEHGIGLFDSVISKASAGGFSDFTLTGSVRTAIYSNTYSDSGSQLYEVSSANNPGEMYWYSTAGVCGWSRGSQALDFTGIDLDHLTLNGSNYVGGLLAHSGNNTSSLNITITECNANAVSLKMAASQPNTNPRNAMGAFVGKVKQGKVVVYGTSSGASNNDLSKFSTVSISSFGFGNASIPYYVSVGGVVGYSGHGFSAYDMKVTSSGITPVTIGNENTGIAGGIVGVMQPYSQNSTEGYGYFKNCTVENVNIQGDYAGGIYGGKWGTNNAWVPYQIEFDNCKVIGGTSDCSIIGGESAGGLVGNGLVYTRTPEKPSNIIVSDCKVTDYDIYAASGMYSGGFIGYCNSFAGGSSITCYIHDSSVENCIIGQPGQVDYAGGAIGGIAKKDDNKILGYNIKLDTVTSESQRMGAWVGYMDQNDTNTSIQFAGMAIYGTGYDKNIGNWTVAKNQANTKTSFVFADYTGACNGDVTISAAADGDTGSESFSIDTASETITRTVVSVSGNEKITRVLTYNYTEAPVSSATDEADGWSVDETHGTITQISGGTKNTYSIAVSSFNAENDANVDMPKYPFVNINPQAKLGSDEIISGDGAVLLSGNVEGFSYTDPEDGEQWYPASKTMAAKIYSELSDTSNSRRYTTFVNAPVSGAATIEDYMKRGVSDDGDRISTYAAERQLGQQEHVSDFAVIVIANGDDDETTNLINRYIQLVTNTTTDYAAGGSDYFNVDIKTCEYKNGSFIILPGTEHGLTNNNGKFQLVNANADSTSGTFTLLDVQFKDPINTQSGGIAYHLYVPVYTVKEMSVKFYSVAKTGAYSASDKANTYEELIEQTLAKTGEDRKLSHVDSLDTWITHYFRYEYEADDITTLLNSGKVRWNYSKTIDFETFTNGDSDLPLPGDPRHPGVNDTYMVLVDPNGGADQVYYANISDMPGYTIAADKTKDCWRIDFSRFRKEDAGNTAFSFPSFNRMIEDSIEAVPNNDGQGKYRLLSLDETQIENGEYDVCVDGEYYGFTNSNDGDTDIRLKDGVTSVYEDYYVSIKVPKPEAYEAGDGYGAYAGYTNELYHYRVKTSEVRLSPGSIVRADGFEGDVRSAGITQQFPCEMLVADLFEQIVTEEVDDRTVSRMTVSPPNEQITAENKTITVDVSVLIRPKNSFGVKYMSDEDFFQSFYLTLNRISENGTENDIQALSRAGISARYSVDSPIVDDAGAPEHNEGRACADITYEPGGNFINVQTFAKGTANYESGGVINRLKASYGQVQAVIYSKIEIDFDEYLLEDEFPKKTAGEEYGVYVKAASNLAYDTETLPHSGMTEDYQTDHHKYYIDSVKSAALHYVSKLNDLDIYDEIGFGSSNRSTLGVNGRSVDDTERTNIPEGAGYMPVNTEAFYDVQEIPNLETAKRLKLTFRLKKKSGGGYGSDLLMQDYLDSNIRFSLNSENAVSVEAAGTVATAVLDVSNYDFSGHMVDIAVTLNAKSGSGFTEYANYRVDLTAELFSDEGCTVPLDNSVATDYLIYTNAKVVPELLSKPSEG